MLLETLVLGAEAEADAIIGVVEELAFDPWRAGQLAPELEREGMTVSVFPQSDARMMPASAVLYEAITERRITAPAVTRTRQARRGRDRTAQHSTVAEAGGSQSPTLAFTSTA